MIWWLVCHPDKNFTDNCIDIQLMILTSKTHGEQKIHMCGFVWRTVPLQNGDNYMCIFQLCRTNFYAGIKSVPPTCYKTPAQARRPQGKESHSALVCRVSAGHAASNLTPGCPLIGLQGAGQAAPNLTPGCPQSYPRLPPILHQTALCCYYLQSGNSI